jgi:hypothetical protein
MIRIKTPEAESESYDSHVVSAEIIKISSAVGERKLSWPRGSKLYDMCVRQNVLGTKTGAVVKEWTSVAGRVTYGIGNALHYWMQNSPDLFGDKRRGWWRCLACRKIAGFGGPPKTKCRFCGAFPEAVIYHEHGIKLSGDPFYLTGHTDMFLDARDLLRVTELKSIDGDKWEKLVAPLAMHEWQIQAYMWALQKDKRLPVPIDPRVGYLAYVSKKFTSGKLPIKIYPIQRSESTVAKIKEQLALFKKGLDNYPKDLPAPIAECDRANFTNYRAKSCPVKDKCLKMLEAA